MRIYSALIALFAGVSAVALLPGGLLPVSAKNSTIVRAMVTLGDLELPAALLTAIEKSDQKASILGYLTNAQIPREFRLQFLETARQSLLPNDLAPRTVKHGDLEIPIALMNAIDKSENKAGVLEYLANPKIAREQRIQFVETIRQALIPDDPRAPKLKEPAKAAKTDNPPAPKADPKQDPKNAAVILIPPPLMQAILKSDQRAAIMEYLNNPDVPAENRLQYLETVRQTLLPDEKK